MELISHSSEETQKIASDLVPKLKSGDILILKGDLGAGKTTFTQGLARALGVKEPVTSPTFVGMQLYEAASSEITTICHIDAYRFQSIDDAISAGIEEYFNKPQTLTIIEWPEQLFGILKISHKTIELQHVDENTRKIKILE